MLNIKALAGAVCIAMCATTATAGKFVFDVTVTGYFDGSGVFNSISPLQFQQTWYSNFEYQPLTPMSLGSLGTGVESKVLPTAAKLAAHDLLEESIARSGLSSTPTFSHVTGAIQSADYNSQPDRNFSNIYFRAGRQISTSSTFTAWEALVYREDSGPFGPIAPPSDVEGYLSSLGAFNFSMLGANTTRPSGCCALIGDYRNYRGSATLNTALTVVPEPGSWALMIAGFGIVGGAIRRRAVAA